MAREENSPTAIPGHLPRTGRETRLVQPFPRNGRGGHGWGSFPFHLRPKRCHDPVRERLRSRVL